jgi:hypothetical protein
MRKMTLKGLIEQTLKEGKDYARLDPNQLYSSLDPNNLYPEIQDPIGYQPIAGGFMSTEAGVIGTWSQNEVYALQDILLQDPSIDFDTHKKFYDTMEKMVPGDIVRLQAGKDVYLAAAFNSYLPGKPLVLFVQ